MLPAYSNFPTVRATSGGEFKLLSEEDKRTLFGRTFVITNESDRMGFRLKGERFAQAQRAEMASSAVTFGTVQLLPDGGLIVLMADHQTSGGYPRIANVISPDLPLLAQLGANDKVAFSLIDIEEAEAAALELECNIRRLKAGCEFGRYW